MSAAGSRSPTTSVLLGIPTSDSARTMVTPATTELLVIVYAPVEVERKQLERVVAITSERLQEILGGRELARAQS